MAFDGIVVADLVHEFRKELINGRISKIIQPENDELPPRSKRPTDRRDCSSARTLLFRLFI